MMQLNTTWVRDEQQLVDGDLTRVDIGTKVNVFSYRRERTARKMLEIESNHL